MRARLAHGDITAVGIAFKNGIIDAEQALDLLDDCDCMRFVEPTPPAKVAL